MKVNTNITVDKELKGKAQSLFKELDLDFSSAISLFLSQAVRENRIPFNIGLDIPNRQTREALEEYDQMKADRTLYKVYDTFADVLNEVRESESDYLSEPLKIRTANAFNKDLKLAIRRGFDIEKLNVVVDLLSHRKALPRQYKDHHLMGNYNGFRECHIQNDWILIYRIDEEELELFLFRNGTHSDLLV